MSGKSNTKQKKQNDGKEYEFKKSVFFPWTKVKMSLDRGQLLITDRKFLLWTIPIGRKKDRSYPLQYITEVDAKYRFGLNAFVASMIFLYAYIYIVSYSFAIDIAIGFVSIFLFSVLLASGLYLLSKGLSYKLYLINKDMKKQTTIDISLREKEKLQEFVDQVNQAIKKR